MSEEVKDKKKKNLSGKQKLFADFYLTEARFNGTKAAEMAEYAGNKATLAQVAYENLRKPDIKSYIDERLSAMSMPANIVIVRLTEISEGKVSDFYDEKGNFNLELAKKRGIDHLLKKIKTKRTIKQTKTEIRPDMRGFLAKDEIEEISSDVEIIYEETEFEIYSAHEAIRDLGRYHKLFTDKTEVTGKDGAPIETSTTHDISKLSLEKLKILKEILLESKK